jgi:hypothetical protein
MDCQDSHFASTSTAPHARSAALRRRYFTE